MFCSEVSFLFPPEGSQLVSLMRDESTFLVLMSALWGRSSQDTDTTRNSRTLLYWFDYNSSLKSWLYLPFLSSYTKESRGDPALRFSSHIVMFSWTEFKGTREPIVPTFFPPHFWVTTAKHNPTQLDWTVQRLQLPFANDMDTKPGKEIIDFLGLPLLQE